MIDKAARLYLAGGLSIIPINPKTKRPFAKLLPQKIDADGNPIFLKEDGDGLVETTETTAIPKGTWEPFQHEPPTGDQLEEWLTHGIVSLAVICGRVSGGLEILDFDVNGYYERWVDLVGGMADDLPVQRTGGGGVQVAWRCDEPGGNQKLAWHPDPTQHSGRQVAIETRGEGGYAVLPPSLHPSGRHYEIVKNRFSSIPQISASTRDYFLHCARQLCQAPKTLQQIEREAIAEAEKEADRERYDGDSVIDAYNNDNDIIQTIGKYGYTRLTGNRYSRPGQPGSGGVVVLNGSNKTYNWSSNDPLDSDTNGNHQPRAPFDYFVEFEHSGNFKEAVKTAAKELGIVGKRVKKRAVETNQIPPDDIDETDNIHDFFMKQSADDEGNAQCVYRLYRDKYLYCPAYGWMEYIGTHWSSEATAEAAVNLSITDTLKTRRKMAVDGEKETIVKETKPTAARKNAVRGQLTDIVTVSASVFDGDPDLLNCRNGVVDLRTGQLLTRTASDRFTYCVEADYDPDTDWGKWDAFLDSVIKDYDAIAEWLRLAVGYSLTGRTSEEIMFYLYGPTRSGKGTFTGAILNLLGDPLAKGVNFSMFTARRDGDSQNFDLAPLKPSRFVSASESGKYQQLNEAVVKQITGNDPVYCAFKRQTPFSYVPQYKVWLSSNHPVKGDVDDDAFWGRVKVIEFPNSFLGKEDKQLKARMVQPEMQNALLAWAVMGACLWYGTPDGLKTPDAIVQSTQSQRSEMDTVQRWLEECTIKKEDAETANANLYQSYESWCNDNGEEPKKARSFGRSMVSKGYEQCQFRDAVGKKQRGYKDIGILL